MALYVHVVAKCHDDGLDLGREFSGWGEDEGLGLAHGGIDDLEHADGECRRLTSTGLGLGDGIATLADLDDCARLDGGGGFVAICVDASKKIFYTEELVIRVG